MPGLIDSARRHRLSLFTISVLVLLGWVLWSARGALPPFVIGVALALVLDPVVTRLQVAGLPRWLGVLVAFGAVVGVLWLLVAFAVPPLARQATDFVNHLPQIGAAVVDLERDVESWYRGLDLPTEVRTFLDQAIASGQTQLVELLKAIAGPTIGTLLRTVTFLFGLVVVPVWLFFALKDRERIPGAVVGALPASWRPDTLNVLAVVGRVGGRWVRGELLLGVAVFSATAVGLVLLTVVGFGEFAQFTLVLALIAGVLEWFPVIGPIIAGVPMLLVGLSISPGAALAAVLLAIAVQQLENNLLVPKVMGDAVDLHPAVLIVALVVGGALFGIGGAILAAPILAIARDLYRYTARRLDSIGPEDALESAIGRAEAPAEDVRTEEPGAPTGGEAGPEAPEGDD